MLVMAYRKTALDSSLRQQNWMRSGLCSQRTISRTMRLAPLCRGTPNSEVNSATAKLLKRWVEMEWK